jgi:hypothetical protein
MKCQLKEREIREFDRFFLPNFGGKDDASSSSQKHYVIIIISSSSITRGASYLWLDHYYCFFFFAHSLSLSLSRFLFVIFVSLLLLLLLLSKRGEIVGQTEEKFGGKILSHARCKKKSKLREYKIFHLQY